MKLTPEIMRARLLIPEPTRADHPVYEVFGDPVDYPTYCPTEQDVFHLETSNRFRFSRQLFKEPGATYWAWTLDGLTPVFPIPMEESGTSH
jgi:hypothetical protein